MTDVSTAAMFPAGVFDLRGWTYYGPNNVVIAAEDFAASTFKTACIRQGKHVFSNEAISKVSAEKAKRRDNGLEPLTEDEERDLKATSLQHYIELWCTEGAWMPERSDGAQGPSETLLEKFVREVGEERALAVIKAKGYKKADTAKGEEVAYIQKKDGKAYPLSAWVKVYRNHKVEGAERVAEIEAEAERRHDAELAKRAARKAAREAAQNAAALEIEEEI